MLGAIIEGLDYYSETSTLLKLRICIFSRKLLVFRNSAFSNDLKENEASK